jgi:hypothetical protein
MVGATADFSCSTGKGPMTSWLKIKRLLKERILPSDFE